MKKQCICIAGKNSIAIAGLSYVLDNYSKKATIYALCDKNDLGQDSWQPSYKKFAIDYGVEILELEDLYEIENLYFISLEYFRLVDPEKFKTSNLFNIHFSILPAYKGMYTSAHPILNGEKISGCTIHKIDAGIDTGAIISQIDFNLSVDNNCKELYEKYLFYGQELAFNTIDSLIAGTFKSTEQPLEGSSYYSKKTIDYSNLAIDLTQKSSEVSKQLRAYTFRDYQLPVINNLDIFGHLITDVSSTEVPGSIVEANKDYLVIATDDFNMNLYIDKLLPLVEAVEKNNQEELQSILRSNPFLIDEKDKRGWTPLIISSFNGYNGMTDILLASGANPNKPNPKGTVPLMYAKDYALQTGDLHCLEVLLEWGADKTHKDIFRKTIYDYLDKNSKYYKKVLTLLD